MSSYLRGLIWGADDDFEFLYTEKNSDVSKTLNTSYISQQFIDNNKDNILSIELNNVQVNNINDKLCSLNFEQITLNKCKINSINNLNNNKSLQKVVIIDSDIKDISTLQVDSLTVISSNISLEDIVKLQNLKDLTYKSNLKENNELICLENLTNLVSLNLSDNKITSISNMGVLPNLISLSITNNLISSIDVLKNYKKLKFINLNHNNITNIKSLINNINIKQLFLSNNLIVDIDCINYFENLEILHINNNPIKTIPNLLQLKNLDYSNLHVNWKNITELKGMKGYLLIKNIISSMMTN